MEQFSSYIMMLLVAWIICLAFALLSILIQMYVGFIRGDKGTSYYNWYLAFIMRLYGYKPKSKKDGTPIEKFPWFRDEELSGYINVKTGTVDTSGMDYLYLFSFTVVGILAAVLLMINKPILALCFGLFLSVTFLARFHFSLYNKVVKHVKNRKVHVKEE